MWPHQHALRQFEGELRPELLLKIEDKNLDLDALWEMSAAEIGALLRHPAAGDRVWRCLEAFPALQLDAQLHPITRSLLLASPFPTYFTLLNGLKRLSNMIAVTADAGIHSLRLTGMKMSSASPFLQHPH